MKILLYFLFSLNCTFLSAQTIIKGKVSDKKNNPLVGANIYFKGTYTGTTSDTNGFYSIQTTLKDSQVLIVKYMGYQTIEKPIVLKTYSIQLNFALVESTGELDQVVITAGSFEAGDKKRAVLLSSLDILTTANAEGDIYGALNMLPGAQKEGETGKIIVRGGESSEMKTFMDGVLISSPYTSRMPDIPARGRFSPFLFNGVMFSTGGYSAEYGQALSSVLVLNTNGLADETLTSISLLNVGAGLAHTQKMNTSSFTLEANYNNLAPYFAMAKHNLDWEKVPESYSGQFRFRQKTGEYGMIKSFLSYSNSQSVLNYKNYVNDTIDRIGMRDENFFYKATYNTRFNEKWIVKTGIAYNYSKEKYDINYDKSSDILKSYHIKLGLVNYPSNKLTVKFGTEQFYMNSYQEYFEGLQLNRYVLNFKDFLVAGYAESDLKLTDQVAVRVGGRAEYSSYINRANVAPRVSFAYKINKAHQISIAYGKFYQHVHTDYLKYTDSLSFENALHYIMNYQYTKNKRIFRIEAYHKKYNNLVRYNTDEITQYTNFVNNGYGHSNGIDIFWRDKKTFNRADYWISYSYVDAKRKYKDYPIVATPVFVSKHNLSVVYKYWFSVIETQLSLSYKFRSGRPYNDPNQSGFLTGKTKSFNDLSISLSHLTSIFGNFTIVYLSCTNILGFNNVFGYRFEQEPDESGTYQAHPLQPYAKRTFIIGIFISIT